MASDIVEELQMRLTIAFFIELEVFYPGGLKIGGSYIRIPMAVIPGYLITSEC